MKNCIIFILLLLPSTAFLQNHWEDIIEDEKSVSVDHLVFQDSIIIVSSRVNTYSSYGTGVLKAYDPSGNELWSKPGSFDRLTCDDTYIYAAGGEGSGDVIQGVDSVWVTTFNSKGDIVKEKDYKFSSSLPSWKALLGVDLTPDNVQILCFQDFALKARGEESTHYSLKEYSPIKSINSLSSVKYLVSADQAIYLTDSSFQNIWALAFKEIIQSILIESDTIYVHFEKFIVRLNENLVIIDTVYESSEGAILDFHRANNKNWVLQEGEDYQIDLIQFSPGKSESPIVFDRFYTSPNFMITKDYYLITGTTFSEQSAVTGYPKSSGITIIGSLPDVELVDFSYEITKYNYTDIGDGDSIFSTADLSLKVEVKNNGAEPITDFRLFIDLKTGMNSYRHHFEQAYDGLSIPAGGVQLVEIERVSVDYMIFNSDENKLCIEAFAPNGLHELNTANNTNCRSATAVAKRPELMTKIDLFPNPTNGAFTAQVSYGEIIRLEIFDLQGRILQSQTVNDKTAQINLEKLERGMYGVRIITNSGEVSQLIRKR